MKNLELHRLEQEIASLGREVAGLVGPERREAAARMRASLIASGNWQESGDGPAIEKFAAGVIGLDELSRHFYGRL